jgi:hypothetical protein
MGHRETMTDQSTEGLRKAARRVFWEAKNLDNQQLAAIREGMEYALKAMRYHATSQSGEATFLKCWHYYQEQHSSDHVDGFCAGVDAAFKSVIEALQEALDETQYKKPWRFHVEE